MGQRQSMRASLGGLLVQILVRFGAKEMWVRRTTVGLSLMASNGLEIVSMLGSKRELIKTDILRRIVDESATGRNKMK